MHGLEHKDETTCRPKHSQGKKVPACISNHWRAGPDRNNDEKPGEVDVEDDVEDDEDDVEDDEGDVGDDVEEDVVVVDA